MRHDVILPKQGIYDGDVELVEWVAQDGASVRVGDVLFVLGTDKVDAEVEAEVSGVLTHEREEGYIGPIGSVVGAVLTDTSPEVA